MFLQIIFAFNEKPDNPRVWRNAGDFQWRESVGCQLERQHQSSLLTMRRIEHVERHCSRMWDNPQVSLRSPSPALIFEIFPIEKWSAVERRENIYEHWTQKMIQKITLIDGSISERISGSSFSSLRPNMRHAGKWTSSSVIENDISQNFWDLK